MAKFSKKMMGKEVGQASVYAPPHNMKGQPVKMAPAGTANNKQYLKDAVVSVANTRIGEYPPEKTSGIKVRGTGAATKGLMARGPMA